MVTYVLTQKDTLDHPLMKKLFLIEKELRRVFLVSGELADIESWCAATGGVILPNMDVAIEQKMVEKTDIERRLSEINNEITKLKSLSVSALGT